MTNAEKNSEVTDFLDNLAHPMRAEIEVLRQIITASSSNLSENIKWNAPNYSFNGADRITMKIQPPKQIQVIFHRGAKTSGVPENRLIDDEAKLLSWRANDRAVATFKSLEEISANESNFIVIVNKWLNAAAD